MSKQQIRGSIISYAHRDWDVYMTVNDCESIPLKNVCDCIVIPQLNLNLAPDILLRLKPTMKLIKKQILTFLNNTKTKWNE